MAKEVIPDDPYWTLRNAFIRGYHSPIFSTHRTLYFTVHVGLPGSNQFQHRAETQGLFPSYPPGKDHWKKKRVGATPK